MARRSRPTNYPKPNSCHAGPQAEHRDAAATVTPPRLRDVALGRDDAACRHRHQAAHPIAPPLPQGSRPAGAGASGESGTLFIPPRLGQSRCVFQNRFRIFIFRNFPARFLRGTRLGVEGPIWDGPARADRRRPERNFEVGLISDRPTGSSGCRAFAAAVQSTTNFGLDGAGHLTRRRCPLLGVEQTMWLRTSKSGNGPKAEVNQPPP
jgi:hypothetical protein